jgi:hypothetical protein
VRSKPFGARGDPSAVATVAQLLSTIAGAGRDRRRVPAGLANGRLSLFIRGLLVWILLTQMFVFYSSQLAGLGGLIVDLVAYGSLRFALTREMISKPDVSNSWRARGRANPGPASCLQMHEFQTEACRDFSALELRVTA